MILRLPLRDLLTTSKISRLLSAPLPKGRQSSFPCMLAGEASYGLC